MTSEATRRSMASNRRRDTAPELALRSELHRRGLRYRVDLRLQFDDGVVRPDVVFTKTRVAVFMDGCFWHGCADHRSIPSGETADFWADKFRRNRERDARDTALLQTHGWTVIRVWEHEDAETAADHIETAVRAERTRGSESD